VDAQIAGTLKTGDAAGSPLPLDQGVADPPETRSASTENLFLFTMNGSEIKKKKRSKVSKLLLC